MTTAIKHPGPLTVWETGEVKDVTGYAHGNPPAGTEFRSDGQLLSQSSTWPTETLMVESNPSSTEAALLGGLLLVVIALAAIIGNVLVILSVYKNRKLRTVTNLFVVSLAFADLMVGALVLPLAIKQQVTESWELGSVTCDVWISLDVLLCTASILNLCCISIDRYLAITRPLVCATKRSRRRASIMIAVVWCLSAVITSPPLFFGLREANRPVNGSICHLTTEAGYVIYSAMGSFYIPLAIMIFVYANIFVVARRAQRRWRSQSGGNCLTLCSGVSRTTSSPSPAPASELPSTTGSEDRKGTVRVVLRGSSNLSRSSWLCCCCLSGGQWTVTVNQVTDWPVPPHGHLRLHVLRSQAPVVNYGGTTQFENRPEAISGVQFTSGTGMTSDDPKIDTNTGTNDVIVGSNVGQRESCSNDMDMSVEESSLSCAHAHSDYGTTTETGKGWCDCRLRHSDSLPVRDDPHPKWIHASESSCHEVNMTAKTAEDIIMEKNVLTATVTKTRSTEFDEDKSCPLASGTSIRTKIQRGGNPDDTGERGLLSQGAASPQVSATARREFHQGSQRGRTMTQERRETNSAALRESKTAKAVSIVIGFFVICWLPFFVVYIAEPFFPSGTFDETLTKFFVWLGYFNSVINPFIYAFYNSDFRLTFWQLTIGRVRRGMSNRVPGRGWVSPTTPSNAARFQSSLRDNAKERVGAYV